MGDFRILPSHVMFSDWDGTSTRPGGGRLCKAPTLRPLVPHPARSDPLGALSLGPPRMRPRPPSQRCRPSCPLAPHTAPLLTQRDQVNPNTGTRLAPPRCSEGTSPSPSAASRVTPFRRHSGPVGRQLPSLLLSEQTELGRVQPCALGPPHEMGPPAASQTGRRLQPTLPPPALHPGDSLPGNFPAVPSPRPLVTD